MGVSFWGLPFNSLWSIVIEWMNALSKPIFISGFLPSPPSCVSIPVHVHTPNLISTLLVLDLSPSGDRFCLLQSKKHRRVKRVMLKQEFNKENNSYHKIKKTKWREQIVVKGWKRVGTSSTGDKESGNCLELGHCNPWANLLSQGKDGVKAKE